MPKHAITSNAKRTKALHIIPPACIAVFVGIFIDRGYFADELWVFFVSGGVNVSVWHGSVWEGVGARMQQAAVVALCSLCNCARRELTASYFGVIQNPQLSITLKGTSYDSLWV